MEVTANGRRVTVPEGATVADLLDRLGLARRTVVVERNGEPIERARVAVTKLAAGDRLEVVRAVSGG